MPGPYTLYKEIRCLPAGTYVWIDGHGTPVEKSFFSLAVLISSSLAPHKSMCSDAELRGYFEDTVSRHLVADVPVGVFFLRVWILQLYALWRLKIRSGGYILLPLGFNEFRGTHLDETPIAEKTAALSLGTTESFSLGSSPLSEDN